MIRGIVNTACRSIPLIAIELLFVASSTNGQSADVFEQSLPVSFTALHNIVAKAGGITLSSRIKQQPGQPIIMECENATQLGLFGAETNCLRQDAAGGQAVRHATELGFQFTSVDPGEYRFWIRVWGKSGIGGPASFTADGKSLGPLDSSPSKSGGWVWISSLPFRLEPGNHHLSLFGDTIYWGATLDRVTIAKSDAPGPTGIGPATTPCALSNGIAETDWLAAEGVSKWRSIEALVAANGCALRWFSRQDKDGRWERLNPSDISGLDPKRPIQFRLEIDACPQGTTPWVGPVQVNFEGAPRTVTLSRGVSYMSTPEGGGQVRSENYEVTFAPDGQIERLKVGAHDAVPPLENGKGGGRLVNRNGALIAPGRPHLQSDGSLATRGKASSIRWQFKPDAIALDALAYDNTLFFFFQAPTDRANRIINARTGRDASNGGLSEKASPQFFFPDGANVLADDKNQYNGAYGCGLVRDDPACGPGLYISMWFNEGNPWHKRLVLHAKPNAADALEVAVEATPADFNFAADKPAQLRFPARLLYGMTRKARAELAYEQLYADPPPARADLKQEVALGPEQTPILWNVQPTKDGLYLAHLRLFGQDELLREMKFAFSYGMDATPPPARPADFDAFWDRTMKKLAATPPETTRTKQFDTPNGTQYLLSFKTINGWPAWALLRVPKKLGKYPAMLLLPPVDTAPTFYGGDYPDRVQMALEARGFDPSLPEAEAASRDVVNYFPYGQMKPAETRESMWLYYALLHPCSRV